ncbi:bifunctional phosphopantothenoylcysteine decarboxylase/phosphopantothenate--cysteine ligase CoaBC [Nesterenkonia pannonica]|uniref:bifunctional phosphopantothenoylcysteine decarboxylase/phosphopantothenate--cysteine ligase CoaBC n=1 Tax=Nesterenkonia pannonica TaxID=1548602 RepID=UPI002164771C|nr:bifunctional phosphopantothenoylcysteine decarboxylase/phosphopantothenate--cysteine ligase CoaBC [Nesterenkonia pannonica]
MRVLLGVTAGIAAYKSATLLRLLRESGCEVDVVPTPSSLEFVGKATWEALSGRPVTTGVFEGVDEVRHVRLGQEADLIVVAPATADVLAKIRGGRADDLLTSSILASEAPKLLVPAMHTEMWRNPATTENVSVLRERGFDVMEPAEGRLTGKDTGKGLLPEPDEIFERAQKHLAGIRAAPSAAVRDEEAQDLRSTPLRGRAVVVTAGGTREPLDPVRFLGNRSSGKQGIELARAAAAAYADVRLILGTAETTVPHADEGIVVERTETADQMLAAVLASAPTSDVLLMAAAVADFRPAAYAEAKIKKTDDGTSPVIELQRNPDILAEAVRRRESSGAPQVIVGFAAETGSADADPADLAREKLQRKGCDLLVLNQVGEGLVFGQDETSIQVFASTAAERTSTSR